MSIPWLLAFPVIAFITVVAPIWIVFHYLTQWKRMQAGRLADGQVAVSKAELERLGSLADRLEDRIEALEQALDAELTGWRER